MKNIYQDIAARTGGSIYIGVVGPVRTGKSTLIKRMMEVMVLPAIQDPTIAQRARDELPQSGSGKTIMTTEPKFVPEEAVEIQPETGVKLKVRLIDSVGYMVEGAMGAEEDGVPRMVSTPWSDSPIPMTEAAELGTKKVMDDHASIGIVVTTDGTITDIPRSDYLRAEERAIRDMQRTGKPFVTIINSADPMGEAAAAVHRELKEKYAIDAAIADCQALTEEGCAALLQDLLYAFPLTEIRVHLPRWLEALDPEDPIRQAIHTALLARCAAIPTLGAAPAELEKLQELEQIQRAFLEETDLGTGTVRCRLTLPDQLYYDTLTQRTGVPIRGDGELMTLLTELTAAKRSYDQIREALDSARATGCGVVMPSQSEMTLQKPELLKKGGSYGVKLKANAGSLHLLRVDLQTELSPMVGSEAQARELLDALSGEEEAVWSYNLFGKSVSDLVREGFEARLRSLSPEVQEKFRASLSKIVSGDAQGLICIIL